MLNVVESSRRTLRDSLEGEELTELLQARDVIARIVCWFNEQRLHSALGCLRPIDYYRDDLTTLHELRRRKLAAGAEPKTREEPEVAAADAAAGVLLTDALKYLIAVETFQRVEARHSQFRRSPSLPSTTRLGTAARPPARTRR